MRPGNRAGGGYGVGGMTASYWSAYFAHFPEPPGGAGGGYSPYGSGGGYRSGGMTG